MALRARQRHGAERHRYSHRQPDDVSAVMTKSLLPLLLLLAAVGARAGEVGGYPSANPLNGSERMLSDQSGVTVDVTPTQIESFLFPVVDSQAALTVKPTVGLVCDSGCGNLTLSGAQSIDGVAGTVGTTIVLATAQTTASQNGPWTMQSSSWTRPQWYQSGGTLQAFQYITTRVKLG